MKPQTKKMIENLQENLMREINANNLERRKLIDEGKHQVALLLYESVLGRVEQYYTLSLILMSEEGLVI